MSEEDDDRAHYAGRDGETVATISVKGWDSIRTCLDNDDEQGAVLLLNSIGIQVRTEREDAVVSANKLLDTLEFQFKTHEERDASIDFVAKALCQTYRLGRTADGRFS